MGSQYSHAHTRPWRNHRPEFPNRDSLRHKYDSSGDEYQHSDRTAADCDIHIHPHRNRYHHRIPLCAIAITYEEVFLFHTSSGVAARRMRNVRAHPVYSVICFGDERAECLTNADSLPANPLDAKRGRAITAGH